MRRVGERGAEGKEENDANEFKNLPIGSSGVHTNYCMTSKSEGWHVSRENLQSFTGLGMPHYVILPN